MIMKVATAQFPNAIGPAKRLRFEIFRSQCRYMPALSPRMTPIPAPLAMPASKALRAHGRSVTCFALFSEPLNFLFGYNINITHLY